LKNCALAKSALHNLVVSDDKAFLTKLKILSCCSGQGCRPRFGKDIV